MRLQLISPPIRLLSLLFVIPFLWACEDDSASGPGFEGGGGNSGRDAGIPISPGEQDMSQADQMVVTPKESRALRLPEGEDARRAFTYQERVDLSVFYVGIAPGGVEQPLANQRLTVRMLDPMGNDQSQAGIGGSRLVSARVPTNAQGRGTFTLVTGEEEVSFRIEVSAPDADPLFFVINVTRPNEGSLAVELNYDTMANRYNFVQLEAAKVSLFEGQVPCASLVGLVNEVRGAYFSWPPLMPFNEVSNTVRADDFAHGSVFTVLAAVTNSTGSAVAYGCHSGALIQGGEETLIEIDLTDLPLEYKGRFTSVNRFDLTDMLRSSGDENLAIVADVLDLVRLVGSNQPGSGAALIDLICDYINVDRQFCLIIQGVGGPFVERLIAENIPEEALQILSLISDVLSIISEMNIVGEFVFVENPDPETGIIEGVDNRWQSFRFLWRNGCAEPNPADCEREFTIGDLERLERPIAGTFNAVVEGETLEIGGHGLNFQYGLIGLGIAESWLLPTLLSEM
ncbi:MAG: hypothetical protein VYD19_04770, partial [Myxococcota bacterium]|nr:hypothetical protein [Myxococcota bacterium]